MTPKWPDQQFASAWKIVSPRSRKQTSRPYGETESETVPHADYIQQQRGGAAGHRVEAIEAGAEAFGAVHAFLSPLKVADGFVNRAEIDVQSGKGRRARLRKG